MSDMTMWKTLYKQKKPFMIWDKICDWTTTRWAFTDMCKRIGSDEWYYILIHFAPGMHPSPYSPYDHLVVTEQELFEYFEEVPESQRDYQPEDLEN